MRASPRRRRTQRLLGAAAAVAVALTPISAFAVSSPTPAPVTTTPRPIAVSVPPEPVTIGAGQTSIVHIRIVNPGRAPVPVTVTGRGLTLGDDGKAAITNAPDPTWQGRVVFPAGELTIPAESFADVFLTVRTPDRIEPDLYFVGFVVSPVPTGTGRVTLINQIGAFFTLDVPGPRARHLTADLQVPGFDLGPIHLGNVTVGTRTTGALRVHNMGHAQVRFWGENDTTSAPGSRTPTQQRIPKSLLPIGRVRTYQLSGKPAWPIGLVAMKVHIIYPDKTDTTTTEIVLTKRMLVINPRAIMIVGALTALAVCWWLRRRHRRRPQTRDVASYRAPNRPAPGARRRPTVATPQRAGRTGRRRGVRRLVDPAGKQRVSTNDGDENLEALGNRGTDDR